MKKHFLNYNISSQLEVIDKNEVLKWVSVAFIDPQNSVYMRTESYAPNNSIDTYLPYQAFKFIREEYGKFALIFSDGYQWTYDLRWSDPEELDKYPSVRFPIKESDREMFDTYEEAEIKAIEKLIEVIKEEK